jgi:hypothetical protein
VASSGNSFINSMSEYWDSEDLALLGRFLFTGGISLSPLRRYYHKLLIQSRDNYLYERGTFLAPLLRLLRQVATPFTKVIIDLKNPYVYDRIMS